MKRAPMKWIDRLAITSYGGLTIVSALRTEWFIAYLLEALLSMELGDALHTAFHEWLDRGQR